MFERKIMNIFWSLEKRNKAKTHIKKLIDKDWKSKTRPNSYTAVQQMRNSKTPGNDGLTKEFYMCMWEDIKRRPGRVFGLWI